MARLKVISENTTYRKEFISHHGLSILISHRGKKFIFDFGQKNEIFNNGKLLDEHFEDVDFGILSHGHYDHSGGILKLLKINGKIQIFAHPEIFTERFSGGKYIGIDREIFKFRGNFSFKKKIFEVMPDTYFLGEIKRYLIEDESVNGFFKKNGEKDRVVDDTSLLFKTEKGWNLITGCCHSGLSNTLLFVRENFNITKYHSILGGFHLKRAGKKKLEIEKKILSETKFDKIFPMHCTGFRGMKFLIENFGEKVNPLNCGDVLDI